MRIRNLDNGTVLASDCRLAKGFWARTRGLLFSPPLEEGEGLLIQPCQSVHTVMMGYPIDVLFLDKDARIAHLIRSMPPYRASRLVWKARSVLELPAGTAERTATTVGDRLTLEA
ncbi:MAG: DUF192 domain-containing protein [Chloroflexota bacterium]